MSHAVGDGTTLENVALRDITKRYGRKCVLAGATLTMTPRTVVGLIGANGSGKTTLLRILLGFVRPDSGSVRLFGLAPRIALSRYRVAYFTGGAGLPLAVRAGRWARLFGVEGSAARDRRRFGAMSRGQRQLVGLRAVLSGSTPDVIVLDEPWEGLDPRGAEWLTSRLRECRDDGAIVLVSSHRLADLAEACDSYAVLHDGLVTMRSRDHLRENGEAARRLRAAYREFTAPGGGT